MKKFLKQLRRAIRMSSEPIPDISDAQAFIEIVNDKIAYWGDGETISTKNYENYFDFLDKLGLKEDFAIKTKSEGIEIKGNITRPIILNKNNKKCIIFCHGLNNNRWSLFYNMHLALQKGYKVVSYDARNHGLSEKSYTSLGQMEACDLQEVIDFIEKRYNPKKIALYGFSMGAATILFWISFFSGSITSEKLPLAICEAPFDVASEQLKNFLGEGINYYWKDILLNRFINNSLRNSREKLVRLNPFLNLPLQIPIKLLLLHGLDDNVINWSASWNIYQKISRNFRNKGKINLYLCENAGHGEFPMMGDHLKGVMWLRKKERKSKLTFSGIFLKSLEKNL